MVRQELPRSSVLLLLGLLLGVLLARQNTVYVLAGSTVGCEDPVPPVNGKVVVVSSTIGDVAVYYCDEGYNLIGQNSRLCLSNNTWDGSPPNCTGVDCVPLDDPDHGVVIVTSNSFGAEATFVCDPGYTLVGNSTRTCKNGVGWDGTSPACIQKECGPLDAPEDGIVEITMGTSGQVATYRCNVGFLISGPETRQCTSGTWESIMPECIPVDCDSFTIPFGDVAMDGTGYGSVAAVTCHSGYSLQGSPVVMCQSNGIWSRKPTCSIIDCGYPGKPNNGILSTPAGTSFGQTAMYSCEPGFRLVGDVIRFCTNQGWNGTLPFCKVIVCPPLLEPQYGSLVMSGTTFGRTAIYSCTAGYTLDGLSRRTCNESGDWSGSTPTCVPVDCGPLTHPVSGTVDTTPGTTFKKAAAYTCYSGYRLVGTNVRLCDSKGNWTDTAPACVIRDCGPLRNPEHGTVSTSSSTTFGQLASYQCDMGFVLVGPRIRACTDMGNWSGSQPTCKVKDCEPLMNPVNGEVNVASSSPGNSAVFSCEPGYRLVGETRLVCQNNSQWDNDPPTCLLIDCKVPENPDNGFVFLSAGTLLNSLALYDCKVGYIRTGARARVCSQNGNWSGEEPHCDIKDCGPPPRLASGAVVAAGTIYGSTARYECERGYNLVGLPEIQCLESGWSGVGPSCSIVDCNDITAPANGFVDLNSTTFGSRVKFSCFPGYRLSGFDTAVCTETSEWNQEPPTCEIIDCGPPPEVVGSVVDTSSGTTIGSIATYYCLDGYSLNGSWIITCNNNGSWEGTPPTCLPIDCGGVAAPFRGVVDISSGTTYQSEALYSCEEGYFVEGSKIQHCQADGEWSGSQPECKLHDCENITAPLNGGINAMTGTTFNETVKFSCNLGYDLFGADTIVCGKNGEWSNSPPLCTATDCGSLPSPGNGTISTTQQTTTFGQVATYSCNLGYNLIGDSYRICQQNGSWSGSAPVCQVIDCGPLTVLTFGSVKAPWGTVYNGQAIYSCDVDGYEMVGDSLRICQANGTWSGKTPVCTLYDCGPLETPTNGVMAIPLGTKHGAVATFYCNNGYRLTGSTTRTCLDKAWTGSQPQCIIRKCSNLYKPANGIVNVLGQTYQSLASYACLPGYDLEGKVNRTCLGNGTWSDAEPICVPIDCGPLEPLTSGNVLTLEGTTFGKTAKYICDIGYKLVGIGNRTCLAGGSWSFSAPSCEIQDCHLPASPVNGMVDVPGDTTYGQIATFSCFTGYNLRGLSLVSCQDNGNWSGSATCDLKDCRFPRSIENGRVDLSSGTTFTSMAVYSCNTGYELRGDSARMCQATGGWSGNQPDCDIIDCGGLSHPVNGVVNFPFGTTYGEALIYTCNPGYLLVGNDTRVCEVTGDWSGVPPFCVIKACDALDAPEHGSVAVTGTTYGNVATYTCEENFEVSGVVNRQCMSDGQWSAAKPTCVLRGDLRAVYMTLTLNATIQEDLSDPAVLEIYKGKVKQLLTDYYKTEMGVNVKDIVISSLWKGSLHVKYELIISGTRQSAEQLGQAIKLLSKTSLGEINNSTVYTSRMTLSNAVVDLAGVDSDLLVCLGYTAASPCEAGYMCILRNSTPACVPDPATDCGPAPVPEKGAVDQSEGTRFGRRVVYSCDPGYSLQGDSVRLCQTDGSWTSTTPVCSPIDCGPPLAPVNGIVLAYTRTTVGHTITYRCNQGYSMSGQSVATCLVSGYWSILPPICIESDCESIQSPPSGSIKIEFGPLGVKATYTCQDGFDLIGTSTRICHNTTKAWTGTAPVCAVKDCGPLSNPVGGVVDLSGGTTYGSVATYSCVLEDFMVSGDKTRLCGVSGVWSGSEPSCILRDCGPLRNPASGNVILSNGTKVGSVAKFFCNPGFQMSGSETLTCVVNGHWSETPPTCVSIVNCPALIDPLQGNVAMTGTYQGAVATYTCNRGYRLVGSSLRTCQSNVTWSSTAPSCQLQDCGPLSAPLDGFVVVTATTCGNTGTFTCKPGHGLVGMETVLCLDTGEWSGMVPSCIPDCPTLLAPGNGKMSLSTSSLGIVTATFTCNLGYNLVGEYQRACQGGTWTGVSPFCIAKDCGPLVNITNGRIGSYNSTSYGQSVTYYCDTGYVLQGDNSVMCLENSTWSSAPTCKLIDCGPPIQPVGGTVVLPFGTQFGQIAFYSCDSGYVREGPAEVRCSETGKWSHNTTCQKKDCGPLLDPVNGHVDLNAGTLYYSQAIYSCNLGYQLTGSTTHICMETGWSGIAPVCALVDCGLPESIANGSISAEEGTTYQQVATYSCNYSYALMGVNTRRCLATGNWSDEKPSCVYFDCGRLDHPDHGHVNTSAGTGYGEVAVYTCSVGYHLNGESRHQCQNTGNWSGTIPSCKIHDCGPLEKPEHGKVAYSGTTYGAMASYKCDSTYTIYGDVTRICDKNGKWTGSKPRCDSQRAFAVALGLGLGIGTLLLLVMVLVVVLILLYKKKHSHHLRDDHRQPLYSMYDSSLSPARYYGPLYLGQEVYSIYPPKPAPPYTDGDEEPVASYFAEDDHHAKSRKQKSTYASEGETNGRHYKWKESRSNPSHSAYEGKSSHTTYDRSSAPSRATKEDRSAASHSIFERTSAPQHSSRDGNFGPPYEMRYAYVERIGRQDYWVPYSNGESRPTTSRL